MKIYDQTTKDKPIICLIQLQFVSVSKYFNRISEYKAGRVVRDYLVHLQALELRHSWQVFDQSVIKMSSGTSLSRGKLCQIREQFGTSRMQKTVVTVSSYMSEWVFPPTPPPAPSKDNIWKTMRMPEALSEDNWKSWAYP